MPDIDLTLSVIPATYAVQELTLSADDDGSPIMGTATTVGDGRALRLQAGVTLTAGDVTWGPFRGLGDYDHDPGEVTTRLYLAETLSQSGPRLYTTVPRTLRGILSPLYPQRDFSDPIWDALYPAEEVVNMPVTGTRDLAQAAGVVVAGLPWLVNTVTYAGSGTYTVIDRPILTILAELLPGTDLAPVSFLAGMTAHGVDLAGQTVRSAVDSMLSPLRIRLIQTSTGLILAGPATADRVFAGAHDLTAERRDDSSAPGAVQVQGGTVEYAAGQGGYSYPRLSAALAQGGDRVRLTWDSASSFSMSVDGEIQDGVAVSGYVVDQLEPGWHSFQLVHISGYTGGEPNYDAPGPRLRVNVTAAPDLNAELFVDTVNGLRLRFTPQDGTNYRVDIGAVRPGTNPGSKLLFSGAVKSQTITAGELLLTPANVLMGQKLEPGSRVGVIITPQVLGDALAPTSLTADVTGEWPAPAGLTANANGSVMTVSWTGEALAYDVELYVSAATPYLVAAETVAGTGWSAGGLQPSQAYVVRVRPTGQQSGAARVNVTTGAAPEAAHPLSPQELFEVGDEGQFTYPTEINGTTNTQRTHYKSGGNIWAEVIDVRAAFPLIRNDGGVLTTVQHTGFQSRTTIVRTFGTGAFKRAELSNETAIEEYAPFGAGNTFTMVGRKTINVNKTWSTDGYNIGLLTREVNESLAVLGNGTEWRRGSTVVNDERFVRTGRDSWWCTTTRTETVWVPTTVNGEVTGSEQRPYTTYSSGPKKPEQLPESETLYLAGDTLTAPVIATLPAADPVPVVEPVLPEDAVDERDASGGSYQVRHARALSGYGAPWVANLPWLRTFSDARTVTLWMMSVAGPTLTRTRVYYTPVGAQRGGAVQSVQVAASVSAGYSETVITKFSADGG